MSTSERCRPHSASPTGASPLMNWATNPPPAMARPMTTATSPALFDVPNSRAAPMHSTAYTTQNSIEPIVDRMRNELNASGGPAGVPSAASGTVVPYLINVATSASTAIAPNTPIATDGFCFLSTLLKVLGSNPSRANVNTPRDTAAAMPIPMPMMSSRMASSTSTENLDPM